MENIITYVFKCLNKLKSFHLFLGIFVVVFTFCKEMSTKEIPVIKEVLPILALILGVLAFIIEFLTNERLNRLVEKIKRRCSETPHSFDNFHNKDAAYQGTRSSFKCIKAQNSSPLLFDILNMQHAAIQSMRRTLNKWKEEEDLYVRCAA